MAHKICPHLLYDIRVSVLIVKLLTKANCVFSRLAFCFGDSFGYHVEYINNRCFALTGGIKMSVIHGNWSVEDIRKVIQSLDDKTGLNGASVPIHLYKSLGDGNTLGTYRPGSREEKRRGFSPILQTLFINGIIRKHTKYFGGIIYEISV